MTFLAGIRFLLTMIKMNLKESKKRQRKYRISVTSLS